MAKSIMNTYKGTCWLCGTEGFTEEHHLFGGANRKRSEHYGLKVDLCPSCHRLGKHAAHTDPAVALKLHQAGQRAFECVHGPRKEFMRIFGKNYLED